MRAVVMESRFRVCASPERFQRFFEHADFSLENSFPTHVRRSCVLEHTESLALRRQWERSNDAAAPFTPEVWELSYGFFDPIGWLTGARLESMSRDVLIDLDPPRKRQSNVVESVPWMVTLTTDTDHTSRAGLARRYPALRLAPLVSFA